jgi:NADH dehydrogenase FAD-containing subunit
MMTFENFSQCSLDDGSELDVSLVFQCTGGQGHSNVRGFKPESLDGANYLKTSDTLQVVGRRNVWAAGDCMSMATSVSMSATSQYEIKNAHTAEQTAKMAAVNILRSVSGAELLHYPEGLAGEGHLVPKIYCVSLGPYDGVLAFNWLVVPGSIAAIFKW